LLFSSSIIILCFLHLQCQISIRGWMDTWPSNHCRSLWATGIFFSFNAVHETLYSNYWYLQHMKLLLEQVSLYLYSCYLQFSYMKYEKWWLLRDYCWKMFPSDTSFLWVAVQCIIFTNNCLPGDTSHSVLWMYCRKKKEVFPVAVVTNKCVLKYFSLKHA